MYQHTVSFRLVHPEGSPAEADFLDTAAAELTGIPGVENFAIHRQVSPKSDLAHQFTMDFDDAEAFERYMAHPAHVAFVETRWIPEVAAAQELDFVVR